MPDTSVSDPQPSASLAEQLRKLKDDAGMSVTSLADRIGSSRTSLHLVLQGKRLPRWEYVTRILHVLNKEDHEAEYRQLWLIAKNQTVAASSEPFSGSVQQNIFQSGRNFTYLHEAGHVALGAHSAAIEQEDDDTIYTEEYLRDLEDEIRSVAKEARRRLSAYRALRFIVLATSAVTPTLALLEAAPIVTAAFGAAAFLTEGAIQLTRLNDRALLDTDRISRLSREFRMYRMRVGDYAGTDTLTRLVQRIEEIREENDNERLSVFKKSFGVTSAGDTIHRSTNPRT